MAKKFILDTELEFDNLLPQNRLFALLFNKFLNKKGNNFVKEIFEDIF